MEVFWITPEGNIAGQSNDVTRILPPSLRLKASVVLSVMLRSLQDFCQHVRCKNLLSREERIALTLHCNGVAAARY
jgi:hypothetical protein